MTFTMPETIDIEDIEDRQDDTKVRSIAPESPPFAFTTGGETVPLNSNATQLKAIIAAQQIKAIIAAQQIVDNLQERLIGQHKKADLIRQELAQAEYKLADLIRESTPSDWEVTTKVIAEPAPTPVDQSPDEPGNHAPEGPIAKDLPDVVDLRTTGLAENILKLLDEAEIVTKEDARRFHVENDGKWSKIKGIGKKKADDIVRVLELE